MLVELLIIERNQADIVDLQTVYTLYVLFRDTINIANPVAAEPIRMFFYI